MLPLAIRDTYKSYKLDTDTFTTWLCNQAKGTGYQTADSSNSAIKPNAVPGSARLKGKDRKKAQDSQPPPVDAQHFKVPIRELLLQAEHVNGCKKPIVKVPYDIQRILYRAITFRKKCSAYFSAFDSQAIQESTSKHQYFTQVLETVQEKLKTNFAPPPKNRPSESQNSSRKLTPRDVDFVNSFAALSTNDIEPDLEVTPEELQQLSKPSSKSKEPFRVYELEQEVEDDLPFLVWCMVLDIHSIHEFITDSWKQYKAGEISIETVSLLTHISIDLVRKVELDLVKVCPTRLLDPNMEKYDSICQFLYNKDERMTAEATMIGARAYLWEFLVLAKGVRKLFHESPNDPPSIGKLGTDLHLERDVFLTKMLLDIYYAIPGLEPEELQVPEKKGIDMCFPRRHQMFLDSITRELNGVYGTHVSVVTCFAAALLCDIHDILGERSSEPYRELRYLGAATHRNIGLDWKTNEKGEIPTDRPGDASLDAMERFGFQQGTRQAHYSTSMIASSIRYNCFGSRKLFTMKEQEHDWETCECCSAFRPERIWPSKDPLFYHKNNPVYSGMETLRLSLALDKLGIHQTHETRAFSAAAYMYHILRQVNRLQGRWPALEAAMEIYKKELFMGEYPQDFQASITRYLLFIGADPAIFAPNARKSTVENISRAGKFKEEDRWERPLLSLLLEEYLDNDINAETFFAKLNLPGLDKSFKSKRGPTGVELLTLLRNATEKALPTMKFDLVKIGKQCVVLSKAIRTKYKAESIMTGQKKAEASDLANPGYIASFFVEQAVSACARGDLLRYKGSDSSSGGSRTEQGRAVDVTVKVFETFLRNLEVHEMAEKPVVAFTVDEVTNGSCLL